MCGYIYAIYSPCQLCVEKDNQSEFFLNFFLFDLFFLDIFFFRWYIVVLDGLAIITLKFNSIHHIPYVKADNSLRKWNGYMLSCFIFWRGFLCLTFVCCVCVRMYMFVCIVSLIFFDFGLNCTFRHRIRHELYSQTLCVHAEMCVCVCVCMCFFRSCELAF